MSQRHRKGTRVNEGPYRCELAAKIVKETACPFCGSPKGIRCMSKPRLRPGDACAGIRAYEMLAPSKSHRARLDVYWQASQDDLEDMRAIKPVW